MVVEIVLPTRRDVAVEMVADAEPFLKSVVAKVMGRLFTRVDRRRSGGYCGITVTAMN